MSSFNVPCRECDTIIRIRHDFVSRVERELAKCPKCGTAVAEDTLIIFSRIFASDQDDLYHVLGVIDDPTNEEILSAYRRIIKQVHPDAWNIVSQETKRATLLDAATKRINEIYDTASSDEYRKKRRREGKKKQEQTPGSDKGETRARGRTRESSRPKTSGSTTRRQSRPGKPQSKRPFWIMVLIRLFVIGVSLIVFTVTLARFVPRVGEMFDSLRERGELPRVTEFVFFLSDHLVSVVQMGVLGFFVDIAVLIGLSFLPKKLRWLRTTWFVVVLAAIVILFGFVFLGLLIPIWKMSSTI
jgi:hypothetical protein